MICCVIDVHHYKSQFDFAFKLIYISQSFRHASVASSSGKWLKAYTTMHYHGSTKLYQRQCTEVVVKYISSVGKNYIIKRKFHFSISLVQFSDTLVFHIIYVSLLFVFEFEI